MKHQSITSFRAILTTLFVYGFSIGVAQAQVQSTSNQNTGNSVDLICTDKAKEAARKVFGQCLADQKTIEIQELRKAYLKSLEDMRAQHKKEIEDLQAERALLRKGVIKDAIKSTTSENLNQQDNLSSTEQKSEQGQVQLQNNQQSVTVEVNAPSVQLKRSDNNTTVLQESANSDDSTKVDIVD